MQKKPTLRRLPPKDEDIVNAETVVPNSYALDGAALLHQVKYLKGSTYADLKLCRMFAGIITLQPLQQPFINEDKCTYQQIPC